jgi:hypothetical protein
MSGYCPDCGNTLCICKEVEAQENAPFSCTGPSDCSAILTMIRNFPSHVGNYDADLPEKECGENRYEEQCAFRQGWAMAVDAINDGISQMQNATAHVRDRSEAEGT